MTAKEILEKYPKIFKDKDLTIKESCMPWGLCVPDDWLPIIDELCDTMQNCGWTSWSSSHEGAIKSGQVVAEQVKSKFNDLRFYYRLEFDRDYRVPDNIVRENYKYVDGMIAYAETQIYRLKNNNEK
jgi:hypothetical protein